MKDRKGNVLNKRRRENVDISSLLPLEEMVGFLLRRQALNRKVGMCITWHRDRRKNNNKNSNNNNYY